MLSARTDGAVVGLAVDDTAQLLDLAVTSIGRCSGAGSSVLTATTSERRFHTGSLAPFPLSTLLCFYADVLVQIPLSTLLCLYAGVLAPIPLSTLLCFYAGFLVLIAAPTVSFPDMAYALLSFFHKYYHLAS